MLLYSIEVIFECFEYKTVMYEFVLDQLQLMFLLSFCHTQFMLMEAIFD